MKRSILRFGLFFGASSLMFATGCHQAAKTEGASSAGAGAAKSGDPSAWSEKDMTRSTDSGSDPDAAPSRPKSSRATGTWSSEAQDVERSLGVGR